MSANRILLFGDSADAPVALIRQLLAKSRHSKNTQLFIQNSVEAVGREIQTLPPPERDAIGIFHSIQDLQECYENKRDPFNIAHIVLNFVARIGELILHAETDPSLLIGNLSTVIALSISGSMLAAAAAAVANDVGELIEVATFLAVVSCRQAVEIRRRGIKIEHESGDWAFSALGEIVTQLPSILDRFHENQRIPQHRQAYIGIQATSWATVFGPPSVLRKLVASSTALRNSNVVMLPALGPAHAPHLRSPDLEYMIGKARFLEKRVKSNYQLISGSTNRPMVGPNLKQLLQHILEDIFQHTANPERVFEAGISFLNREQDTSLFVLGNTSYLPSFKRTLQKKRVKVAIKSNSSTQERLENHVVSESVAIVGMSGRFPGSDTVEELWASIMERKEFHKKIPSDRFDADNLDSKSTLYGCFLEHPGLFDHKLFNVSPREAIQMDPGQRLLLHTTYEALEDAGVTTNGTRSTDTKRVSTFIGIGADDWRELHQALGVDSHWIHGNERAFASGRLNHYFKWEGATFCVDSACASAATATALAFKALINRDCDTAIVGGANIIATPFWHSALSRGGFLSLTGGCKTFREDADGYCRGEAVGVLVLKRQDDALQDNDKIISVIRGYARNHSAKSTSITHPHAGTQERLYRSLLNKTGLEPHDIGYIEFHGTGTTAGDSTELESISNVFAKAGSRQKPLVVGAIKANIGHSEAAAGILSLIKGAMVLQKETIPAQVGIPQKLGHYPCLENGQILVPGNAMPFSGHTVGQGKKRILVNNFDAAGGNTCFVLEEPCNKGQSKSLDPRPFHVVTVSAHSTASLDQNKRRMLQFLKENRDISLADLAYTTTARRNHHSLRAAYYGASTEDIAEALTNDLNGVGQHPSATDKKPPVVFVFSGQGGSYAGMGEDLFKTSSQFRGIIAELEQTCDALGFSPFTSLIADQDTRIESVNIVQHHLSLVALQIALTKYWEFCGIKPDIVIGHSIGEYAALCAAGVFSIFDTLYLVGKRAQLLHSRCVAGTHAMLSIAGTANEISSFLSEEDHKGYEVSCFNSPGMVVLSGERQEVLTLETVLKGRGLKCQLLDIPYGMHSCQMDAILSDFDHILSGVQFSKPKIKIISTLLGHLPKDAPYLEKDYLIRQTREPVKFQQAIASCVSEGFADTSSYWLEIGPNATCLGLVRANINVQSSHVLTSLKRGENNWKSVSVNLATFYTARQPINWRAFHRDFADSLSLVDLPKYAFDTRDFWLTYKRNDQRLQANDRVMKKSPASDPISTCLHHLVKRVDDDQKQSASFTSAMSHSSLLQIVEGHKLSGISVCSAGVYIDIALTAARYLLTGGDLMGPSPALTISDMQLERPLVPTSNGFSKVIYSEITRQTHQWTEFSVSFSDGSGPSSALANCRVRLQDQSIFDIETPKLYSSLKPKISSLVAASEAGLADRIRGKVFYKLFSNLMEYSDLYKGVESAVVSDDFRELFANVHLTAHDEKRADQRFTFSPYWSDILGQTLGFLLNGNPNNQAGDYVHMGAHIERFEVQARDILPDGRYQIYAYIYHSEGLEHRGNAYISHEDVVVGALEGMRFHKMPRKTLHYLLGKIDDPEIKNGFQNKNLETVVKSKSGSAEPAVLQNGQESNGHAVSLTGAFLRILLDETGLLASEVAPSANFSEIGVDSIFGISILAALKAETGVELGASFLSENPTLEDAQRALQIIENQKATLSTSNTLSNRHTNGHSIKEESPISSRESNVVLMQSTLTPSRTSLFLIADGAGSAAAYVHLPQLAQNLQVFALESPWAKDPRNFTCSFSEAAAIYLKAIRSKQPRGPYLLGGWSAGGVFAYEVSRLLLEEGEKVIGLIIIDIPAPRHVDRSEVAMPTFEIVENMGLLVGIDRATANGSAYSIQLKEHMLGTVRCFSQLDPTPMEPGCRPDATFVIWATEIIGPKISSNGSAKLTGLNLDAWFYPMQHDFGPNGWDLLVGDKVDCFQIQGDHFSIMNVPHVKQLGQALRQVIVRCLGSFR